MSTRAYADCDEEKLRRLYVLWSKGHLTKVSIERKFFNDVASQAKGITGAWRDRLGIETEGRSALSVRCEELEKQFAEEMELAAKKFSEHGHVGLAGRFRARALEVLS